MQTAMLRATGGSSLAAHRACRPAARSRAAALIAHAAKPRTSGTCTAQEGPSPAAAAAVVSASTLALALLQPALAVADEAAVVEATAAAGDPAQASPLGYVVIFAPIVLYGIFSLYRDKVNPRATISDFLFILAALAVFANLISIFAFRVRLF